MRARRIASLFVLLTGTGWAAAEAPPAGGPLLVAQPAPVWTAGDAGTAVWSTDGNADGGRACVWGSAEYLLWWVKDGPLPFPFVTTGDPASPNPGTLGLGGVPILTGKDIEYTAKSGVRVSAGGWLDSDGRLGIEGSGFLLPRQSKTLAAASDANGNPVLTFRYKDPPDPVTGVAAEDAFQATLPPGNGAGVGPFAGGLAVISTTQLWGAEINAVFGLGDGSGMRLMGLVGFRYADLYETLTLPWVSRAVDGASVLFEGNAFPAPSSVTTLDTFRARNQFYGGQVGFRGEFGMGKIVVGAGAKVALGDNHEVLTVLGTSTLVPDVGSAVRVSGGQFAAPSNSGRFTHDEFAVIPEVEVKVGYQATSCVRATVGYNFLYWNRVVRPGNQVDLIVDDRTNPVNGAFAAGTTGTLFPRREFNRSDFWAQGLTLGLEFRY
jgi:hypothetical protein